MDLKNNVILITGGSSGIGLELAKRLSKHNKILTCARSLDKLQKAKRKLPNIEIFQCNLSEKSECERLVNWVLDYHSDCNVLINNAAIAHSFHFYEEEHAIRKAEMEISVNFMAPVILSKLLIPILNRNRYPQLINITTGLVYAPRAIYPYYNATKAALHSFTQVLRLQLKSSPISIVEVLFPVVDTPWHKGNTPAIAINVDRAVSEMISEIEKGRQEVRVGKVKILHLLSRLAPSFTLRKINSLK